MKSKTINKEEINKFSQMASEWWDPEGKFAPLHKFNPIRIKWKNSGAIFNYFLAKIACSFSNLIRLFTFGSLSSFRRLNYCVL